MAKDLKRPDAVAPEPLEHHPRRTVREAGHLDDTCHGADPEEVGACGVVYTGAARHALLDLPATLPPEIRSASEPYAALCARTIRDKLGATWGLAETGAAGPTVRPVFSSAFDRAPPERARSSMWAMT